MTEKHTHHHHHHHHHHDYVKNNAELFSERAQTYRSELSLELAKRCAGVLLKNYSFDPNKTEVLDFACGPGLIAWELLPYVKRIVGADAAQGMVDVFNQTVEQQGISTDKLHCIKSDSLKNDQTDFDGLNFDVIFCAQAYHHFEDLTYMTRALANHLKPNGRLFIIDFITNDDLNHFFGKMHGDEDLHIVAHKHGFSSEQIINILKSADLKNPQFQNAFKLSKTEAKTYQGHEIFHKAMDSNTDFTLSYFIAYADK